MRKKIYCAYPSTTVFASKQDEQNLTDFAGEEVAQKFLSLRKKLKSPENDLYYWIKNKTPEELESFVDNYQSNRDTKSSSKTSGAKLVFNKNGDKIYFITTYDAMQFYGKGTKWCIAGNYDGHESRGQKYFDDYLEDLGSSGYYVVITPNTKICILVENDNTYQLSSFWNAADDEISLEEFVKLVSAETAEFFGITEDGYIYWSGEHDISNNLRVLRVIVEDGVTTITDNAFYDCEFLENVEIPSSVTRIDDGAFYGCKSLTSIEIPDSVTSIGDDVFHRCTSLQSIELPDSVTSMGESAFYIQSLKKITFGRGLNSLGNYIRYYM